MILLLALFATEWIDLDMTPQEKRETGLVKLSDRQKSALQHWIDNHYEKRQTPIALPQAGKKPTVSFVEYNGKDTFVHLCDGSCWKIESKDAPIAQGWINPEVEILISGDAKTLTNTLSKSSVQASKIK